MPRLLQRNQRAIARAADAAARARLLAERVLLLARHWRVQELPEALADAEAAVAACADRRAAAELWLARGVAMYYGAQAADCVEPLRRALAAAREVGDDGLEAECEAWLGCLGATLQGEPLAVLRQLRRAVELGMDRRPLAVARAYYVAATMYQEAGLVDAATLHYRRASALAHAQSDEQLAAAVFRYMTLGQVQQVRRAQAAGQLDEELRKQAQAALGSAAQLTRALTSDEHCLQFGLRLGEMLRVSGQHEAALPVFDAHLDAAEQRGMTWEAAIARADQAVCLLRCGRIDAARRAGARAQAGLAGAHDAYSRALVHDSLAELAQALGEPGAAATFAAEAGRWWDEDRRYCARLRDTLLEHGPLAA